MNSYEQRRSLADIDALDQRVREQQESEQQKAAQANRLQKPTKTGAMKK